MDAHPAAARTVRLGVVVLMLSAVASVWHLMASQSPGTAFYLGVLPGPVGMLRETCFQLGVLLLLGGLLMPWAAPKGPPRWWLPTLYLGTLLGLGASLYAAQAGMHAVQMGDMHPDALPLFISKHLGLGLVLLCLAELGRRLLTRQPS